MKNRGENMELTPAEERLIKSLRAIDERNPLGIDGFSVSLILPTLQRIVAEQATEGERRYKLFLKQSKGQAVIDIREAQREKTADDDPRPGPSIWA